jgi:hypothetical protein
MNISMVVRSLGVVCIALSLECIAEEGPTPEVAAQPDLHAIALKLQEEVTELRGLPFKKPVLAEIQPPEAFEKFLDERVTEVMPEAVDMHYGAIVKRLGLYRGVLDDFRGTAKSVMGSQAAAYYDPETEKFYVLWQDMPALMQNMLYSHELYHGLQDQYFGLEKYLPTTSEGGFALDGDQMLARQSVVEGEATYIMTMWMMRQMTKQVPTRESMEPIVRMQSQMDMDMLKAMIKQAKIPELSSGSMDTALQAAESIPYFLMETLIGAYLKGMNFVFAVQEHGWAEVEKLYTEYPPQSTEQILHPEKWRARESPSSVEWPSFARVRQLKEWDLLTSDVIGEFQWRVIFNEQGLRNEAEAAAAGWDGDRYAVFKRKGSDATLLLLRTSWDSTAQAEEFATAYRQLLVNKYADASDPTRVVQRREDVFIVEGGNEKDIDALVKVVSKAKKTKT